MQARTLSYFRLVVFVASILIVSTLSASATIGVSYQLLLGNPSNAISDTNNHDHYLIQRDVEALDYNDTRRQPNWASWNFISVDNGSASRSTVFFLDTTLPPNFNPVLPTDYSGSGYDRGHMCPVSVRRPN